MVHWFIDGTELCPRKQAAPHKYAALNDLAVNVNDSVKDTFLGEKKAERLSRHKPREVAQFIQTRSRRRVEVLFDSTCELVV